MCGLGDGQRQGPQPLGAFSNSSKKSILLGHGTFYMVKSYLKCMN